MEVRAQTLRLAWSGYVRTAQCTPLVQDEPAGWFHLVDADGSGKLSKRELYEVFAATLDVDLDRSDPTRNTPPYMIQKVAA